MENLEREAYCMNLDCVSNYFDGETSVKQKLNLDWSGILRCEVCGYSLKVCPFCK